MIRTGKKFSKPEMSRVVNGDTILPEAPEKLEKKRLDHILMGIYKSYNRSTLQKFIENGFVKVDGEVVVKSNTKFPDGVKIDLTVPEEQKNADVEPRVIYEDENVLVVDKPAGLLSEAKGEYCPERTLADFGLVVHRLDRDTSGVMILAKNEEVQKFLKKQFQDRKVHKTYYAVVEGEPKLAEARIDLPLLRNKKRPTTFLVDANGKESETFYKVLQCNTVCALVELKPTSGRTHQLRVHMQYIGHPILGDPVYGEPESVARVEKILGRELEQRLYLHAKELEITLPGGKRVTFEAEVPESFDHVV